MPTLTMKKICLIVFLLTGLLLVPIASGKGMGSGRVDPRFKSLVEAIKVKLDKGDYPNAEKAARELYEAYGQSGVVKQELFGAVTANGGTFKASAAQFLFGKVLFEEGKYNEAESFFRQALPLRIQIFGEEAYPTTNVMFMLGRTLIQQGKYAEANQILQHALELIEHLYGAGNPDSTKIRNHIGNVMLHLGQYADAEIIYKKALKYSEGSEDKVHLRFRAATLYGLARAMKETSRYTDAENYARLSLELRERLFGKEHPDTAISLGMLGLIVLNEGRLQDARTLLEKALPIHQKALGNNHPDTAKVEEGLAVINWKENKIGDADKLFRHAIASSKQAGAQTEFANFSRKYGLFLVQQKRLEAALIAYRDAIDALDLVFANTRGLSDEVRETFIGKYSPFYTEMLQLLLRLHEASPTNGYDQEALSVLSRTQSRLFTELLRRADVNKTASDPDFLNLTQQLQSLQAQQSALTKAKIATGNEANIQTNDSGNSDEESDVGDTQDLSSILDPQINRIKDELKLVEDALWKKYPRYMELTRPRPVTVEDLQKRLLKPDDAVLTFALLPDKTALFVVTRDFFRMVIVPQGRSKIAELIHAVREPEERASSTGSLTVLKALNPEHLYSLYQMLVQPVEENLKQAGRIIVIGDGPIYTLPMEMLVTSYNDVERQAFTTTRQAGQALLGEYSNLNYLGNRYRFAYLPSLASLSSQRLYPKPVVAYERELVSFSDPMFENEKGATYGEKTRSILQELSQTVRGRGQSIRIPRLPETADEARGIAKIVGGKSDLFMRENAQECVVKSQDLKKVRYVHFATHGFLGGEFLLVKEASLVDGQGVSGSQRNLTVVATQANNGSLTQSATAALPPSPPPAKGGQPALALSLVGDLKGEDGLLTMREVIEDLNLNAQLVVLSACNTAGEGSDANNGEGFAGLTRAFMYAGTKGLLVSHWSVESLATQELMTDTFQQIKNGNSVLASLNTARQSIAHSQNGKVSRSHPYFWAPFVYVGD